MSRRYPQQGSEVLEIEVLRRFVKELLIGLAQLPVISNLRRTALKHFLTILIYHRIDPELFDDHIDFLERYFNIISLGDVLEAYSSEMGKKFPEKNFAKMNFTK